MAGYNSNSGGSQDMYSDAEPQSNAPAPEEEHDDEGGETTTIPKSLCPDMKPGDEVVLQIVKGTEDDWIVKYAPKKGASEEPAPSGNTSSSDGSMASMME